MTWDRIKARYVGDGLCDACAAQAAYGHQLGWHYHSSREWPEVDRRIKPPCPACAPIVATFPVAVPGSPWRHWPKGDRRPVNTASSHSERGHSKDTGNQVAVIPATSKAAL